jgi:hypothetical protein
MMDGEYDDTGDFDGDSGGDTATIEREDSASRSKRDYHTGTESALRRRIERQKRERSSGFDTDRSAVRRGVKARDTEENGPDPDVGLSAPIGPCGGRSRSKGSLTPKRLSVRT